jgi:hypothetical protein
MIRRGRWIVLVLVVLLVAVVLAGVLLVRPDLVDARDRVDARWDALQSELTDRYVALSTVTSALDAAGAEDRGVTRELHRELERFVDLREGKQADRALQAANANDLEALARRARANFEQSDRLHGDQNLLAAFQAFDQQVVPEPERRAYNRAVRKYEAARDGVFERIVAGALGFEGRPILFISA